jgi:hypothetical protein
MITYPRAPDISKYASISSAGNNTPFWQHNVQIKHFYVPEFCIKMHNILNNIIILNIIILNIILNIK